MPPKTLRNISWQGSYADDLILSALADRLPTAIVVFAWVPERQTWERSVACNKFKNDGRAIGDKGAPPIILMRREHRHQSLDSDGQEQSIPDAWLKRTEVKPRNLYRGGGPRSACSRLILPASRSQSRKSALSLPLVSSLQLRPQSVLRLRFHS